MTQETLIPTIAIWTVIEVSLLDADMTADEREEFVEQLAGTFMQTDGIDVISSNPMNLKFYVDANQIPRLRQEVKQALETACSGRALAVSFAEDL